MASAGELPTKISLKIKIDNNNNNNMKIKFNVRSLLYVALMQPQVYHFYSLLIIFPYKTKIEIMRELLYCNMGLNEIT